ncbi:two-component sensor histidine kinase [Synergistales bacterium]|nr:two-component sensor histidine kinase [Synergistales bacterium]
MAERRKNIKKSGGRLYKLAAAVFLPPFCVVLFAAFSISYLQYDLTTLLRSCAENFTAAVAARLERRADFFVYNDYHGDSTTYGYPMLFGGNYAIMAVLDDKGAFLYGDERLEEITRRMRGKIPLVTPREVWEGAETFTVCAVPVQNGKYFAMGAISWESIPGTADRVLSKWLLMTAVMGLGSGMAIWWLWHKAVIPIGELEREITSLKWGEEVPGKKDFNAVSELVDLRYTLTILANEAVYRSSVIQKRMSDIINIEEFERMKLSREIHDGPLQDITALMQRLRLARHPENSPEETDAALDLAEIIAKATVKDMRELCNSLNPPWIDLGLHQALSELTKRQQAQYNVRIALEFDDALELPQAAALSFFRIVQEAVTNSVKHGAAKNIFVEVRENDDGHIELCVQDDGRGFILKEERAAWLRSKGHRGISNMEERMTLIGGRLEIISSPGEGTAVRGTIP